MKVLWRGRMIIFNEVKKEQFKVAARGEILTYQKSPSVFPSDLLL